MSKLDEVDYEIYTGARPERKDGSYIGITDKTREQLKDIISEIAYESEGKPEKIEKLVNEL